ncbi:preprotein translocase subunit SecD [Bathymodiolus platifrons methanotrophic gill symbiont]|uniref:protein translocase subunit SecD n=1 Tax=Bathymodiolus platifrons methanotrophic gill symbiont TaxID=113268 RepID=UPI000B41216E|nr:protein translocase subunit SecD [Bathymodiolus platifrons methanotrophic gill symbiont]MCK5870451.1 protein translocase subunit SecD [Methyloprofundus sp.]TXK96741.1 protein translocase subunit SecD [Methylococcaceae bacterium CS4]TXL01093.1 protein translocase subunit SecD [Methylococcaceae bacterium CS5]TXL04528.1 protein translocase subunit SecD [Methylococcaceae bacterium CS3]TXL04912.1 protein translocase subunit SecD [Methylococcaceae bacterium CS1]TXL10620.1 protein translocase sub
MQNHFPLWKNLLIITVLILGIVYSLPNLFGDDPSVQISAGNSLEISAVQLENIESTLSSAGITAKAIELQGSKILARFNNTEDQMRAADLWRNSLGGKFTVALNLAPATPDWLRSLGAEPMYLGLDLRGGVHFLLEVDMVAALKQAEERYNNDIRMALRTAKIRYKSVTFDKGAVKVVLRNDKDKQAAIALVDDEFRKLDMKVDETQPVIFLSISEQEIREIKKFALAQNITTLRNRVNELGVSEPVIQQQGDSRIVVQLPGVQDTAQAKEILGTTATLEYRKVDTQHDVQNALDGRVPVGSRLYYERDTNAPVLLKRRVIITGDQIVDASSGLDQNGSASVNITLNGIGAKKMGKFTKNNIGQPMAVVFIEQKSTTKIVNGKKIRHKEKIEEVISIATVRDAFSKRFQTTGLDSPQEARKLSLLLRAGALAAPVDIVEERTVGPSLGQDNIDKGMLSVLVGFVLVLVFMAVYYKTFGLIANLALTFNLVVIVAVLSMLQATLTLPGIAGIVLTVGMAVDANVLIFERIKEELRNRNSPQTSIFLGYEKAFATIFDANITTLLVALVLFGFGTGPIKGFAITLAIGILTSMFTAILGSRMVINWIYGARQRIDKLSI